jgi:hypothetical protein
MIGTHHKVLLRTRRSGANAWSPKSNKISNTNEGLSLDGSFLKDMVDLWLESITAAMPVTLQRSQGQRRLIRLHFEYPLGPDRELGDRAINANKTDDHQMM